MSHRPDGVGHAFDVVPSVPDAFADMVADQLSAGVTTLFCSGGELAAQCYRALAERHRAEPAAPPDWSSVDVYYGDERCVPLDHPDSNHRLVATVLLDAVGPVRSDHPMYRGGSPAAAADHYQRELDLLPDFGLVHLGLGPDGHTASLFAGAPALGVAEPGRWVVATVDPQGRNPHERITLTFAGIARAKTVVVTVAGRSKREALERVLAGDDLPAARIEGADVHWLVDPEAAGSRNLGR